MEIYEELRAMGLEMEVEDEMPAGVSLPRFIFPSDVKVRCAVADDGDILSSLCDEIRTQAAGNCGVVGFGIEWDIALSGAPENPPATFQLTTGGSANLARPEDAADGASRVLSWPSRGRQLNFHRRRHQWRLHQNRQVLRR